MKVQCLVGFAPRDRTLFERLARHLRALERTGTVELWSPAQALPGSDRAATIEQRLATAHIVLLLVSAAFLASDPTYTLMLEAIDRTIDGSARVVPVIARPCDWRSSPIGRLIALPSNGKPIAAWSDREAALSDVSSGLARIVAELQAGAPPADQRA